MKLSFLTGQLFGVINYAALTDHIYLDLSGIFQFSFDLFGNITRKQYHIGIADLLRWDPNAHFASRLDRKGLVYSLEGVGNIF